MAMTEHPSTRETAEAVMAEWVARDKAESATNPVWSLPAAVGWIAWGNQDHMPLDVRLGLDALVRFRAEQQGDDPENAVWAFSDSQSVLARAANELRSALIEGRLVAYGIADEGARRSGAIEKDQWPLLQLDWTQNRAFWGSSPEPAYTELTVLRAEVMKCWRDAAGQQEVEMSVSEGSENLPTIQVVGQAGTLPEHVAPDETGPAPRAIIEAMWRLWQGEPPPVLKHKEWSAAAWSDARTKHPELSPVLPARTSFDRARKAVKSWLAEQ